MSPLLCQAYENYLTGIFLSLPWLLNLLLTLPFFNKYGIPASSRISNQTWLSHFSVCAQILILSHPQSLGDYLYMIGTQSMFNDDSLHTVSNTGQSEFANLWLEKNCKD